MKYIIQGQNIKSTYKLNDNKNNDGTFSKKPKLKVCTTDITYENIIEFESNGIEENTQSKLSWSVFSYPPRLFELNISETESVAIIEKIFRADLVTTFLRSSKVLSRTDNKSDITNDYNVSLSEYCNYICNKYPKVKRHIEIYNIALPIEEIDEIVYEIEGKCTSEFATGGVVEYTGVIRI